jgi:tripartite ATP-independent transporter DctM subunit
MVWIILIAGLGVLAWTGMPIGVGLALIGLVILHLLAGGAEALAISSVWNVFTSFTMSAAPLFIFMGSTLLASGLSRRIYGAIAPFFSRIPGKLLHTNIAACTLFGAVSGTSMATAAAIGSVAYPELRNRGYQPEIVVGTLAAGGTLGLLIPPSLSLLIYGAFQEVSIGRLFLAGVIPGLMMAALFMAMIFVQAIRNPSLVPQGSDDMSSREKLRGLLAIWPLGILVFAVLGTIYLGLATPTEAAGLGVAASIFTGFIWGDLSFRKLGESFYMSAVTFGAIGIVVVGALVLAQAISILGVPQDVVGAISELRMSKYAVLAVVVVIYLVLGCFFDGTSLMLMTIPIVHPVMTDLGFDAVWLGVIITMLIEIGMLTPPVGINLFVLVAMTERRVTLGGASLAALPYWLLLLVGVVILTFFPQIALFLPNLLM